MPRQVQVPLPQETTSSEFELASTISCPRSKALVQLQRTGSNLDALVSALGQSLVSCRSQFRLSIGVALFCFLVMAPSSLLAIEVDSPMTCYDFANQPKIKVYLQNKYKRVTFARCQIVYFDRYADKVWYAGGALQGVSSAAYNAGHQDVIAALLGSKVLLSGSVLAIDLGPSGEDTQNECTSLDWKVVTQTKESANVLIFGPADLGPGMCTKSRFLIALPVHVLWAEITPLKARKDPTRKPPAAYADKPLSADCASSVRLCDRDDWPSGWFYKTRYVYNIATQPGSSNGTISYSPVIGGATGNPKLTYDIQLSSAGQVGPGWLGFPLTFEKDSNPAANLDSLLTGASYDLRPVIGPNLITSPHLSLRKPQFQLKSLFEFAPTGSQPTGTHDLNLVEGETVRFPFAFTFNRQPSALVITPILGLEEGNHIQTHIAEGNYVFRGLGGGDVSYLWPYNFLHNLLGDKPITLAFSYRAHWLASPEPFTDVANQGTEMASTRTRSYWRTSLVEPLSSYVQFKVSVQHGELPPDFRRLAYSLNIGLTLTNPGNSEY
jgi:hypothetical protein